MSVMPEQWRQPRPDLSRSEPKSTRPQDLDAFRGDGYEKGRGLVTQILWFWTQNVIFRKWWLPHQLRPHILRLFGAEVGRKVLIRHDVRVHWPWKLSIGDSSWIGEGAWLMTLEPIAIGRNVCISQEARIVSGSHDHRSPTFEFDNGMVIIEDNCWIATGACVLRGVRIGAGTVVAGRSLLSKSAPPNSMVFGEQATIKSELHCRADREI